MQKRRNFTGILSALGMLALILDGKTAIAGAAEGIRLCIRAVIPSLFPFFVLSNLLLGAVAGRNFLLIQPLRRFFSVPRGAETILLSGFLGGYPVGAQGVAQAFRQGQLSQREAERMLAFCNQAGPSFLFGIVAPMFSPAKVWGLWLLQILSAVLVARCIPPAGNSPVYMTGKQTSLPESLYASLKIMANVCGWIVLLRICIAFLQRWILWILPTPWQVALMGSLELANGCLSLKTIADEGLRFLVCSGLLSFGGICVSMQTASVTKGLKLDLYFPGKLLQAALSMLLSWFLFPTDRTIPLFLIPITAAVFVYLRKTEKLCGNPATVGV